MGPKEAILFRGVVQYAQYDGYGSTFRCCGPNNGLDLSRGEVVVAVDALQYKKGPHGRSQYKEADMLRELNKLRAALGEGGGFEDEDDAGGNAASVAGAPNAAQLHEEAVAAARAKSFDV